VTTTIRNRVHQIPVGLGEIKLCRRPGEALVAYGLGSCVGVAIWDRAHRFAGLAHVILPVATPGSRPDDNRYKYADYAVPALIEEMIRQGSIKAGLIIRIAGGAQMLRSAQVSEVFNIGARNVEQVRREVARAGLRIAAEDVLGHLGRTMSIFPDDGRVTVHSAGKLTEL
jgi:chemotaxis protein CheD